MAKRTTHRSSKGRKLYAVRSKKGKFKDIQTYKKAHGQDVKRQSKAELGRIANSLLGAIETDKKDRAEWKRGQRRAAKVLGVKLHGSYKWKRDPEVTAFMKTFRGFITSHFGKRCATVENGCGCCQMWKAYDLVDTMIVYLHLGGLMLHKPELAELVTYETSRVYKTAAERAAYRAGMSTAAAACDYAASEYGGKNKLKRAQSMAAKLCGDMIEGLRGMVEVPDQNDDAPKEPL